MNEPVVIDVALILVFGSAVSWLCQRLRLPAAVVQVILGVILGGAVLGWVSHSSTIHVLGEIGVVLLLGMAGIEMGLERLKRAGWPAVAVAVIGIVLSLSGGYFVGSFFGSPRPEAIYIGLVIAATSIGISTQVLQQFGLINHRIGEIVVAAALIDDVIALYLLAATHGILSDDAGIARVLAYVMAALVLLGAVYWLSKALTSWLLRQRYLDRNWSLIVWAVGVFSAAAMISMLLQFSPVVGSFFAGVGIGDAMEKRSREHRLRGFQPLLWVLMPFFFVMIGVQAEWSALAEPGTRWFLVVLLVVAISAKALGGLLGSSRQTRVAERCLIGFGMVPRGEVALIIATLGLEQGHVGADAFAALVLTTICLAILGPVCMAFLAKSVRSRIAGVTAC